MATLWGTILATAAIPWSVSPIPLRTKPLVNILVPGAGVEPARDNPRDFKSGYRDSTKPQVKVRIPDLGFYIAKLW